MTNTRKETDSLGVVEVPATRCGALKPSVRLNSSDREDLIPREMIKA